MAQQNAKSPSATVTQRYDVASGNGIQIYLVGKVTGKKSAHYSWQQTVTTSDPIGSGQKAGVPFNDSSPDTGLYYSSSQQTEAEAAGLKYGGVSVFYDDPHREAGVSYTWSAQLSLIGIDKSGKQTTLWTGTYGFTSDSTGVHVSPVTGVTP